MNDRAIALMDQGKIAEAERIFRRLTEGAPRSITARFNLSISLLNYLGTELDERRKAHEECEKILKALLVDAPDSIHAHYTLGILSRYWGKTAEARQHFERAYALDPLCADNSYAVARELFDARDFAGARKLLAETLALESHFYGAWYLLSGVLARLDLSAERAEALEMNQKFNDDLMKRFKVIEEKYNFMGRYATCIREMDRFDGSKPPVAAEEPEIVFEADSPASAVSVADASPVIVAAKKSAKVELGRLHGRFTGIAVFDADADGRDEVFVAETTGGTMKKRKPDGSWEDVQKIAVGDAKSVVLGGQFADLDHDGNLDLVTFGIGPTRVFFGKPGGIDDRRVLLLPDDGDVTTSIVCADFDHDGDIDILAAGTAKIGEANEFSDKDRTFPNDFPPGRTRLWNNNRPTMYEKEVAVPPIDKMFVDIAKKENFGDASRHVTTFAAADFDDDGDIDIWEASTEAPARLFLNERMWNWREVSARFGIDRPVSAWGAFAGDLTNDGRPDVVFSGGPGGKIEAWTNKSGRSFVADPLRSQPSVGTIAVGDFDNDGDQDAVEMTPSGAITRRTNGDGSIKRTPIAGFAEGDGSSLAVTDVDGNGLLDVVVARPSAPPRVLFNGTKTTNKWIRLALRGKESFSPSESWANTFGTGSTVEVSARGRKIHGQIGTTSGFLAGSSSVLHLGLGSADRADTVRIIWSDLVLQSEIDLAAGKTHTIAEENRKPSSCPVVFKENAEGGFDFVTDFLGVGGLGFFIAPGVYAPPDPTELIGLGELTPRAGRYALRIAEPMEEICYYDELKLVVVDHPESTEAHADERLAVAAPWPSGRPIVHGTRIHPKSAVTRNGEDSTAEVKKRDRVYQKGVRRDRGFIGYLAEEMAIDLRFDRESLLAARPSADAKLALYIDGWVEYPYSRVNFALWQANRSGQSLSLDVLDESGVYRTALADFGYPAGLSRTMAVPIDGLGVEKTSALRLRTNLEIYLDEVYLAWEAPKDAVVRELAFDSAELRHLGYPLEHSPDGKLPTIYDYNRLDPTVVWKTMGGLYTRFGDVRELLTAADDRYVVSGPGEELALTISEGRVGPVAPGMKRTFFLKADGWCKDMDPYTASPDSVFPLPFHGMTSFPPSPTEDRSIEILADLIDTLSRRIDPTFGR